jgi:hypothetical protein
MKNKSVTIKSAWIGFGGMLIAAIIGLFGFFFNDPDGNKTINSNINASDSSKITVINNQNDIKGDYVAGNKTTNIHDHSYLKPNQATDPEILAVKPIYYSDKSVYDDDTDMVLIESKKGIVFILKIKNGTEPKSVNGLKIRNKMHLNYLQLTGLHLAIGKSSTELKGIIRDRKPYLQIDWDAYTTKKSITNFLQPNQIAYIGFILIEPSMEGNWGWEQFINYESDSHAKIKTQTVPNATLFFADIQNKYPKKIREGFRYYLILDDKEYLVQNERIMFVDRINEWEWQNDSFEKMFIRYWN